MHSAVAKEDEELLEKLNTLVDIRGETLKAGQELNNVLSESNTEEDKLLLAKLEEYFLARQAVIDLAHDLQGIVAETHR